MLATWFDNSEETRPCPFLHRAQFNLNKRLILNQWLHKECLIITAYTQNHVYYNVATPCREGNGSPLQYSCLENPRNNGAWWAAIYGAAQSQTQLKRLSSSSRKPTLSYDYQLSSRLNYFELNLDGTIFLDLFLSKQDLVESTCLQNSDLNWRK